MHFGTHLLVLFHIYAAAAAATSATMPDTIAMFLFLLGKFLNFCGCFPIYIGSCKFSLLPTFFMFLFHSLSLSLWRCWWFTHIYKTIIAYICAIQMHWQVSSPPSLPLFFMASHATATKTWSSRREHYFSWLKINRDTWTVKPLCNFLLHHHFPFFFARLPLLIEIYTDRHLGT